MAPLGHVRGGSSPQVVALLQERAEQEESFADESVARLEARRLHPIPAAILDEESRALPDVHAADEAPHWHSEVTPRPHRETGDVKVHVRRVERRLETVLAHATRLAAGRQLPATGVEVVPLEV